MGVENRFPAQSSGELHAAEPRRLIHLSGRLDQDVDPQPGAGVARTCFVGPRFFVVNWGRTADLQNRSALLNAYAGVDAAEQQSRCGLTIDPVRLPADEKARIRS